MDTLQNNTQFFHYKGFKIPVDLVIKTGGGMETWDAISRGHMKQYEKYAPIQPTHRVLEIGCGVGRDAIQLIDVLGTTGEYFGIDIILPSIEWCQTNITPAHPNFHFLYYDIDSDIHNTLGTIKTTGIALPLMDGSVDRIILQSVFTHMFEEDIVHYLKEFQRVLKPDGLVVASFFITDAVSREAAQRNNVLNEPHAPLRFEYTYGGTDSGCYVNEKEYPEGAVGYTPEALERMLRVSKMTTDQPIHRGFWSKRYKTEDLQDILILKKTLNDEQTIVQDIAPTETTPELVKNEEPVFSYHGYDIPIRLLNLTGGGSETWDVIGKGHMEQYKKYAPIEKDHNVLEVGCGIGRDAMHLNDYIGVNGKYIGMDIIPESIEWCQKNITPTHPNFQFFYFDIKSQIHNPNGTLHTTEIRLPANDGSIDRTILQSVFTHMFESDITHYLKEFHRVLKPDGRVVASIFITDEESIKMANNTDDPNYPHRPLKFEYFYGPEENGCRINDEEYPEGAVGYTKEALERILKKSQMMLAEPIHQGHWCGRKNTTDGQDMLVLKKVV